eukprot:37440_1
MSYDHSNDFAGNVILGSQDNETQQPWNKTQNTSTFQCHARRTDYFDRSLMPLSLKRILSAPLPSEEEPMEIDGKPLHQIEVICTIETIEPKQTFTLFVVEDYGVKMKAKLWCSNDDDMKQVEKYGVTVGDVVKITGRVEIFQSIRSINIHHIAKITNFNTMHFHGFEQILSHQMNNIMVNKHIGSYSNVFDKYVEMQTTDYKKQQQNYSSQKQHSSPQSSRSRTQSQHYQTQNSSDYPPSFGQNRERFTNNNNNNNNGNNNGNSNNNKNDNDDSFTMNNEHQNILSHLRNNTQNDDDGVGLPIAQICNGVGCGSIHNIKHLLSELEKP